MHPTPTRITLAGSILVLGSLGTMSAVNLTSSPSPLGAIPGAPQAMSPMQVLRPDEGDRPAAPEKAAPSIPPALARTRSVPDTKPGARLPVSAHDLVGLATGTLEHAVLVPLDDLTRALPVHDVVKALDRVPDHTVRTVDKVITSATGDLEHELGQRAVRDVGQVLAPRKDTDVPVGNELGAAVARRVGEQVRRTMNSYGMPFHTVSAPTSHTDSGDSNTSYGRHTLVTQGWSAQHNGDQSGSGHKSAGKSGSGHDNAEESAGSGRAGSTSSGRHSAAESGGSGRHSASFTSSGGGSHANGSKSSGGSHSGRSKGSGGSHSGGSRGSGGKHRG
jgi:hypothetical protein